MTNLAALSGAMLKPIRLFTLGLLSLFAITNRGLAGPEIPGEKQSRPVAMVGGTIHPVSGPAIENGVLLFDDGKIVAVGQDVEIPVDAERIELKGKHVYPGLFDAFTDMGLVEINSVRATRDQAETGDVNPNVRSWVAVNPDSELIPVGRANGVLLTLTAPVGGLISGKSAVMQLDGWTYEDMTLQPDVGMHVQWPRMAPVSDWAVEESAKEQMKRRDEALERLRQTFDDARAYQKARQADGERHPLDLRWEAMLPVLDGELPLIVAANDIQQIQSAVAFAAEQKVRMILYGGYDAPHAAALLKKHDIPVIVGEVYRLPERRSDPYDTPFTVPERLRQAGVPFCISGAGRFGASNVRNLPYHAAMAAAFGLPRDEALRAITLSPAEILGVADRVGSLEPSKDATLFIATGDPLETPMQVTAAYIQGRRVNLDNRHKRLYRKYREKLQRLEEERP
ncbi:MAG: amidohydrolase family protein [Planctomycetes bacterium]|nr:amidohydrolase family protein [Planctomycetota bacterium]